MLTEYQDFRWGSHGSGNFWQLLYYRHCSDNRKKKCNEWLHTQNEIFYWQLFVEECTSWILGIAIRAEKTSPSTGASKRNASKKEKELNTSLSTQHDEIVITPILGSSSPPLPAHSHFGGKKPKQHKPPKCISVLCKDEKEKLNTRLQDVNERELEGIKEELSKCELVMPFSIIKFWKIIEYTTLFPEAFFYFLLANFEALSA